MRFVLNDKQKLLGQVATERVESKANLLATKFGNNVKTIEITVSDLNGPRGGIDKECRIVVSLKRMQDVVVTTKDEKLSKAISAVINRAERSVRRTLDRQAKRDVNSHSRLEVLFN